MPTTQELAGMTSSAATAPTVCFSRSRFTGKERDTESGNDYFGARYYASTFGRFMSPDWSAKVEPVPYAKMDDPQSFNLYAYVANNPFIRVDIDGHINGGQLIAEYCSDGVSCIEGEGGYAAQLTADLQPPYQAQQQEPQPVATMKVVVPTHPIAPGQKETDAAFGIAYMDANGKLTPMSTDESHQLTMTETLDTSKSSGKAPQICDKGCTTALSGTETVTDAMRVSGKNVVVLDKHFSVDGQPVKVIDPNTGKARDFVHQESSVKRGTNLSFGDNP